MVKSINIQLSNKEYNKLKADKEDKGLTWKEYLKNGK